jgi:hypothetical protein
MPDDAMSAITTELQLRVQGVAEAVRGLNAVGAAARNTGNTLRRDLSAGARFNAGSAGSMLSLVGVGSVSTLGIGLGVSALYRGIEEIKSTVADYNNWLQREGYKSQTFWQQLFGEGLKVDPAAMSRRIEREVNASMSNLGEVISRTREKIAFETGTETAEQKTRRQVREFEERQAALRPDAIRTRLSGAYKEQLFRLNFEEENAPKIAQEEYNRRRKEIQARIAAIDKANAERTAAEEKREREMLIKMRESERDIERGNVFLRQAMGMAEADYKTGPRYAGLTLAGSHEARMDAARDQWEESFDLQETANDYLRQILEKTSATVIYGIN